MTATAFDQYREDVAGRANVADTPELLAYYKRLQSLGTGALWTVANKIEPWEPVSTSLPMLWRYADLREHVLRALDLVTPNRRAGVSSISKIPVVQTSWPRSGGSIRGCR